MLGGGYPKIWDIFIKGINFLFENVFCTRLIMSGDGTSAENENIIDGSAIALPIRTDVKRDAQSLTNTTACLGTIIVGDRPDSATYVRMKMKACKDCSISTLCESLPGTASEEDVINAVRNFNEDSTIHGILVQLPLPDHISERRVLAEIDIAKDVDGFHPIHVGNLAMKGRDPLFISCTARGCLELLKKSGVVIAGKHAVVLGRSNIVGLPVSLLLLHENATVTIAHSHTEHLPSVVRTADILIAAAGKREMVKGDWIKPGCVVIDVGIHLKPDSSKKSGHRLVGDVDFEECSKRASLISPVPGGVGPMTIAFLLRNCVDAAIRYDKSLNANLGRDE